MLQNAAQTGLVRLGRGLASLLIPLLVAAPAMAGDRAMADFIGFSEDGHYFAFEEFGVQDGSGFAYSSIYVLDLTTDEWVIGTPVRIEAHDEVTALEDIRGMADERAKPILDSVGIVVPAEIAALVGDGVPENDGRTLRFGAPGPETDAVLGDYELALSSFTAASSLPCEEWFGSAPQGYELNVVATGGSPQLLHRDEDLPRSRECPLEYRLYGVVVPFGAGSLANGVVVISVYPGAFEGPNRRFIAVPFSL